ncbi:MAG: hypothetical protein NT040_02425 [Bacteroidetes bacterium]|nr:hypothetical protein [Bacteroidota bacterium]
MSTREIKQLLHESIENIDDGEFLLAVKQKTISDRQADLLVEKWLSE